MTQSGNNKKIKVCLVSISLAKGGAERSCAMLSQMLHKLGYQVHIVLLNDDIDFTYKGTLFNLGILIKEPDTFLKRLLRFKKLRNFLLNHSFDVIIDHRPKNNYLRELFYKKYIYKSMKAIYVIHSSKKEEYFTSKPKKFINIYNNNSVTIAVSNYIKNEIADKLGIKNCKTIHNAYDSNWNSNNIERPIEIMNKEYILSYGRIDDDVKDLTFLIQAFTFSEIWKKNRYLVILGDGKDKEKLKIFASKLPSSKQIIFLPFTPNPFPYIVYAKFVTLTSFYEGFPMVLVETLSLGIPVVSLDIVSGPSEIIKD